MSNISGLSTQLNQVITWVRRIIKSSSAQSIDDNTIGDYINRFYVYDMSERLQLFELKTQYVFDTIPNIFTYQFPYPNYQLLENPVYCDGVQMGFFTSNDQFYKVFPEFVNNEQPQLGDNITGPYTFNVQRFPILRGFIDANNTLQPYVYVTAQAANGIQYYIVDSGNYNADGTGVMIETDSTFQNVLNADAGFVNYITGDITVSFINLIPEFDNNGNPNHINLQSSPYSAGRPRAMLFFDNVMKIYPVPDRQYKISIDTYFTPVQFLDTNNAVKYAYMMEYIARGAARKILSDVGDYDQFAFYEPLFKEQECLVLRRTSRQRSVEKTPTIFSGQSMNNPFIFTQY